MTILTRSEPLYIFGDVGHCAVSVTDTWWVRAKSAHKHPRPIPPHPPSFLPPSFTVYDRKMFWSSTPTTVAAEQYHSQVSGLHVVFWTRSDVKVGVLGPDMSTVPAASETIYEPLENSRYIYLTVSHFKPKI